MPSTTSTLAPELLSGSAGPSEGSSTPRPAPAEERRSVAVERPRAQPEERPSIRPSRDRRESGRSEAAPPLAEVRARPLVHVVIVHHRGLEMLEACLASLLASEQTALEIVVVLNHCLEDVPELARKTANIHLLELAVSHGFGEANNLGVAWARQHLGQADYYYFVNNDTRSLPETLPRLVEQLEAAPAAAIAGPQTLIESAPDFINSLGLNVTEDAWGWDEGIGIALCDYGPLPGVRRVMAVTGSALLIGAEAFTRIGGWSEVYDYYFEDIDLGIKAWKSGHEVLHVPDSVIFHRVSATMTVGSERKFFFFWRNRLLLAGIHWPLGLLLSVLKRAIVAEVIRRPWSDSSLQRRALLGALLKSPRILRERWRQRGNDSWRRFLHPPGSVPRITLPQPGEVPASKAPKLSAEEAPDTDISPLPITGGAALAELPAVAAAAPPEFAISAAQLERLRGAAPPAADGRRLLVFGWSPLPFENERMNYAPGTRSWQFAAALAAEGHLVVLACAPIPGATFAPPPACELAEKSGVLLLRLELAAIENPAERARLIAAVAPDALIGAAPGPSLWAASCARELPLWVDFFGDPLAEGQAREAIYPELETFGAYSLQVAALLRRGDAFSAVSQRQRLALIGQLGLAGRLRGEAAGHELVAVLPCAAENSVAPAAAELPAAADDFVVFWSGGFNTWCDVPTLVAGLETAMDAEPRLRFVATGGEITGHDDRTAAQLRQLVAASRHRDRFALLGQVPLAEADAWLRRADLTLITEKKLYERELGSSGRVSAWLAAGKAILCANCSELAAELAAAELVLTYAAEDADSLGRSLVAAASSRNQLRELAARASAYAEKHLGYAATTAPLRAWARAPHRSPAASGTASAPDRRFLVQAEAEALTGQLALQQAIGAELQKERDLLRGELTSLESRYRELAAERAAVQEELALSRDAYHGLRGELGRIHQSRMWKLWMGYFSARAWLRNLLGLGKTG